MVAQTNMVFSESTNKTGMYELFQDFTFTNSTSYTAYKYARDANNALADYFMLAIGASGKWQVDDTNFTSYPEIKVNLTSGQFDYPLTTDADSSANQILDIEKVEMCVDTSGTADKFISLNAYDEMENPNESIVYDRNTTGVPSRYSKRANGIFLDPTPNYSCTNGLRIFFARTPSYFAGTDTTKVAGIPHAHQMYLVLKPAYEYCVVNLRERAPGLLILLNEKTQEIKNYYARRNRDEHRNIISAEIDFM